MFVRFYDERSFYSSLPYGGFSNVNSEKNTILTSSAQNYPNSYREKMSYILENTVENPTCPYLKTWYNPT
jgi:hypothetical protein